MPTRTRTRTRAQNRAQRIAAESNHNRQARQAHRSPCETYASEAHDAASDPDPPPF